MGERAVAWPAHETAALVAAQIAGQSPNQIKALVSRLMADRKRIFARFEPASAAAA